MYPSKAETLLMSRLFDMLESQPMYNLAKTYIQSTPNILGQDPRLLADVFEQLSNHKPASLRSTMDLINAPYNTDVTSQVFNKYVSPSTPNTLSDLTLALPKTLPAPAAAAPTQFNITNPEKIAKLAQRTSKAATAPTTAATAKPASGIKQWFSNAKQRVQSGGPLLDVNGPGLQNIKDARTNLLGTRLWNNGPKISTAANTINAGIQGVQALKGLYDNSQTDTDISDLKQDVRELKLSNPMYANNLTPDQLKTLRQLDSGTHGADFGDALEGGLKGIPKALFGALMGGLTGNLPGAIIGGVGSLVNSGIEGYGKAQQEQVADLQGLYEALNQGYSDYRSMKRPSNLYTGGLQSRYRNMYN